MGICDEICRNGFTFWFWYSIINQMKRRLTRILVKNTKSIKIFVPNDVRLSFYIVPLGDVSTKTTFTKQNLDSIALLEAQDFVNTTLFSQSDFIEAGNIYALLDEKVLKGTKTGADLGIYNYSPISNEEKLNDKNTNVKNKTISYDDYGFRYCVLAEENPLGGNETQVVLTFRGYLEVTSGEFSFIRNCDCSKKQFSIVYMPKYYVDKYHLRHGDEIVCTCKEDNGKMIISSLFTINQISRYQWDVNRPWFNELKNGKPKALKGKGEYTQTIINKFGLFKSDNVFMYLTKTTQKQQTLSQLINELGQMFDKLIYINPNYNHINTVDEQYDIAKFCTKLNDCKNKKVTTILLGAQYAKRLIEMNESVAIIIDDIEAIVSLDSDNADEMPICTTLLSTAIASTPKGSGTCFSIVSLRTREIKSVILPNVCKSAETLGVVIDNNEIDLFNSYRV
jgi:hypothetical protein